MEMGVDELALISLFLIDVRCCSSGGVGVFLETCEELKPEERKSRRVTNFDDLRARIWILWVRNPQFWKWLLFLLVFRIRHW